jgi:EAL domain-containing protein (putative c-di-GMP-specific phosphodiesterase class I)/GGDEF domain-containing protein
VDPKLSDEVLGYLAEFVHDSREFVGVADTWGRILYLNPAAQKLLGVADYDGLTIADVFPGDSFVGPYYDVIRPELLKNGAWSGELLVDVPGRGVVPMQVATSGRIGPGGETNGGVMFAHVVTPDDASPAEASLGRGSTGVLAQHEFAEALQSTLARASHDGSMSALVIIEVDRPPATVASGSGTSADVLASLGERMHRLARTFDTVGVVDPQRLGMVLRGVRSHSEALRVARLLCEALMELPVATPAGDITLSLRYGVAVAKPDENASELLERACAISKGGGPHTDPSDVPHRLAGRPGQSVTLGEFRLALSHGFVRPYAQPVVDVASQHVIGYRGLTRWHHQRHGILGAETFIDMISDSPLAAQVDFYIARETAAVLALVAREEPLRLYTPVSRRLMEDVRVEQYLLEIAAAFNLAPAQISLQIPRTTVIDATPGIHAVLRALIEAGMQLVLTGIKSTADINDFAKCGFTEFFLSPGLTSAGDAQGEISSIVTAAHEHHCAVGAAGVRDEEHHQFLSAIGCDVATGDLYGKPEPTHHID